MKKIIFIFFAVISFIGCSDKECPVCPDPEPDPKKLVEVYVVYAKDKSMGKYYMPYAEVYWGDDTVRVKNEPRHTTITVPNNTLLTAKFKYTPLPITSFDIEIIETIIDTIASDKLLWHIE